uniref:Transposase MuDR plant domain-containing protein n=1 Tax=Ananas comosus var. bracteatus TaxID=296719 RepID=A0A6V7P230_ANACO|nr:unnamed protein product [Ananas comosus var. bracteatus]
MHSDVKVLELFVTIKSNSIPISSGNLGTGGNEFGQRYSSANLRVQTDEQPLYRDDKSVDDQGEKEFGDQEILNIGDQAEENRDQATKNIDGADGIDIDDSNVVWSENSFHSRYSSDSEEEVVDYLDVYKVDKENPVMEVGSMFPNKETLKTALNQYALLHEFDVKVEKSDKKRLTVVCAAQSCKWRLHASVKTMQGEHVCSSINKCGNKMASQAWICDRVVEWLRTEGDLSVKELQKRLRKNYNAEVPYLRCFRGKELAIQEIFGKWEDSYVQLLAFKEELIRRNPEV